MLPRLFLRLSQFDLISPDTPLSAGYRGKKLTRLQPAATNLPIGRRPETVNYSTLNAANEPISAGSYVRRQKRSLTPRLVVMGW